jgi:thymidylate synthase
MRVFDIRRAFADRLLNEDFVIDKNGGKVLEVVGASFTADDVAIFGTPNEDYIARELLWYESQSLNVNTIPGGPPAIWTQVADKDGFINSNYGWCIYSEENGFQYDNVLIELTNNPNSRRAEMIYTRPTMWQDYDRNGRSDFMCTNTVQYLIRNNKLEAVVQMRSNDAIFGFKNDLAWQQTVLEMLSVDLGLEPGDITWQVGSLHVYERHFYLVDYFAEFGEHDVTKDVYKDRMGARAEWA